MLSYFKFLFIEVLPIGEIVTKLIGCLFLYLCCVVELIKNAESVVGGGLIIYRCLFIVSCYFPRG